MPVISPTKSVRQRKGRYGSGGGGRRDNAQADFRAWDKQIREKRKRIAEKRRDAVGILSPDLLRKHAKPTAQDLILDYGKRGETVTYTPAELQTMVRALKYRKKIFEAKDRGVPRLQLIAVSLPSRIDRANNKGAGGITNSTLGKIRGDTLTFQVKASKRSKYKSHAVMLRLEGWAGALMGAKNYKSAVKEAVNGRISVQCSCPDFQFRFRYICTLGNFIVSPPKEHGYPKITNPKLRGCCCKHILKSLKAVESLGVQRILMREMEKQAGKVGFADDKVTRFLNKSDLRKAARAVKKPIDAKDAKRLWRERRKLQQSFKTTAKKIMKQQVKEIKKQKDRAEKLKALGQQHLIGGIKTALEMGKQFDMPVEKSLGVWAKNNNLTQNAAMKIAKENGLI